MRELRSRRIGDVARRVRAWIETALAAVFTRSACFVARRVRAWIETLKNLFLEKLGYHVACCVRAWIETKTPCA